MALYMENCEAAFCGGDGVYIASGSATINGLRTHHNAGNGLASGNRTQALYLTEVDAYENALNGLDLRSEEAYLSFIRSRRNGLDGVRWEQRPAKRGRRR